MDGGYSNDGKYEGNISVLGQTGCRKTTFIQNLAKNKQKYWITKIPLSAQREKNISSCFQKNFDFIYPQTTD